MGGSPLDENCEHTALRELEEETGLIADEIKQIQYLHVSNSITDEQAYVYLATNLRQGKQALEDTEQGMEVLKLPLREAIAMAQDGQITDAISISALLYVALNATQLKIKI